VATGSSQQEAPAVSAVLDKTGNLNMSLGNPDIGAFTQIFFGVINDGPSLTDHGPVPGWGPEAAAAVQQFAQALVDIRPYASQLLHQTAYRLLLPPGGVVPIPMPCEYLAERIGVLGDELANANSPEEQARLERSLALAERLYAEEGCTTLP
jgi:hypothetical protein